MKFVVAALAVVFAAAAATPAQVAPIVESQGFFIEEGGDATPEGVGRAVSDARAAGSLFYAVVLADEPLSGATTYADGVLDRLPRTEGTVLVVATETVGWASNNDIWITDELNEALDASLSGSSSEDVIAIFVGELVNPSSSGSGLWILLLIVLAVGGVIAFMVWRSNRASKARKQEILGELKAKTQERIDALANDILDDEDEVEQADNVQAGDHFDAATKIYSAASDRLAAASSPGDVLEVSADVDEGIWHLDCAEAILDGEALPPKPEPPKPESAPSAKVPPSSTPNKPTSTEPLPTYKRRSSRRSNFGTDDMLRTVLAMGAVRAMSGGRRRSRASGTGSRGRSRSSSPGRSRSSGRSRGGGRRRG